MSITLPEGLILRPVTREDLEAIHRLVQAYDCAHYGYADNPFSGVQAWFSAPGLDLAEDTCLAFQQDGQLVASMLLEQHLHAKFFVTVRILPGYNDPRLGDYLFDLAEGRAREQMAQAEPDVRVTMTGWVPSVDRDSLQYYAQAGFQQIRRHWRMEIELNEEPAAPVWPEGLELRPFVPGRDDLQTFEMIDTAFQDHWGHVPGRRIEEWRHWTLERANFDPALWFVAYEGERIAGGSLCFNEGTIGWVDDLAVLRPWRRRGLGLALLQHSFGAFYRCGLRKAGLGVDSQNFTGATRLYQRAGMHIARETIAYEKELRPGIELSTQEMPD